MGRQLGEEKKEARLQAVLSPALLNRIADYQHTVRLNSKSETIRLLIKLALETSFPSEHLNVLQQIQDAINTRPCTMGKHYEARERIHIALESIEREEVADYRDAAQHVSTTETVRVLLRIALDGNFPRAHLDIINQVVAPRRAIRERAHLIWVREGCSEGKEGEHWRKAQEELAEENRAAPHRPRKKIGGVDWTNDLCC
jgi:hypothetical protein